MTTGSIARVVPAIPSFSVDGGFRYRIPEAIQDLIAVGSIVRVPLAGRRVRGFVVEILEADTDGLRDIAQLSGRSPVFDDRHLPFLRWAASHYVAPLAAVLERTAPPNNPPKPPEPVSESPLDPIEKPENLLEGVLDRPAQITAWLVSQPPADDLVAISRVLAARGQSLMIIASTAAEVARVADSMAGRMDVSVRAVHGESSDRETTTIWSDCRHRPNVVVGTPRIAMWPVFRLGATIVMQEGRRAMKDRQTPTFHVRDLLIERSRRERFHAIFLGPTPSLETLARSPHVVRSRGRLWPLVEVVDRSLETTHGRLLTEVARRAVQSVTRRGGSVFVFAHRRGYAAAVRCVQCRTVRRCPSCGSRPDPGSSCTRCGAELGSCGTCGSTRFEALGSGTGRLVEEVKRFLGPNTVGAHPSDTPVSVGTESDLPSLSQHDLVVFTDVDGLLFGTNYRAAEECLRIGARLASVVSGRTGGRMLLQTSAPDHPIVRALQRSDPLPALERELATRRKYGYPPSGELIVVELRGDFDELEVTTQLESMAAPAMILGPAPSSDATRWLVQGPQLEEFRDRARGAVQRWRDTGAVVRIDVDPIDL